MPSRRFSNNGLGLLSGLIRDPQYSLAATAVLLMVVGGEAKKFWLLFLENKAAYLWIDVMTVAGV